MVLRPAPSLAQGPCHPLLRRPGAILELWKDVRFPCVVGLVNQL